MREGSPLQVTSDLTQFEQPLASRSHFSLRRLQLMHAEVGISGFLKEPARPRSCGKWALRSGGAWGIWEDIGGVVEELTVSRRRRS